VKQIIYKRVYLGNQVQVRGDIDGSVVGDAGVFEGVYVQKISRFGGELNRTISGGSSSLHHEGVVVSDEVPNKC
jgi:carbonic anhydrase/acetyltransferase-like protein (isoleucine patch superfamily)